MTNVWPMVPLGNLLTPVQRVEAVDAAKEYRLLGIRLDGRGPFHRETKLGSQSAADRLYQVRTGDFIYSRLFAWRGAFGIISQELDGCYVSGEFPTFVPVPSKVEVRFLWLWFRLPTTLTMVEANCSGSTPLTRNRFKEHFFLAMEIPLPPLNEQRRIVARIEALAAKIEEARGLRQNAVEEAASFVSSLHLKLAQTRVVKLSNILMLDELQEGVQLGKQYPQVGVKGFGQGLFARETLDASQTTYKRFNRLYDGAVVLSQVKGWEGAIAVCRSDLAGRYVSPEYRTFRCVPRMAIPEYLGVLFSIPWFWSQLKNLTRGVGGRRERIRPEFFLDMELPMPTVEQQQQAMAVFDKLDALKQLQAQTQRELDALLPSVLDKAFKGEL